MKRRKNLEKAIILGLLLSTSVYGNAWAVNIGPVDDNTVLEPVYHEDVVIVGGTSNAIEIINAEMDAKEVNIITKDQLTSGDGSIKVSSGQMGIYLNGNGSIGLNSTGDNNITVYLKNLDEEKDVAYGIYADKNSNGSIKLSANNNTILVDFDDAGEGAYGIFADQNTNVGIYLEANAGSNKINSTSNAIASYGNGDINLTANGGGNILNSETNTIFVWGGSGNVNITGEYNQITTNNTYLYGIKSENNGNVNVTALKGNNKIDAINVSAGGKVNIMAAEGCNEISGEEYVLGSNSGIIHVEASHDNIIKGNGTNSQALHTENEGRIELIANAGENRITAYASAATINTYQNIIKSYKNNYIAIDDCELGFGSAINSTNGGIDIISINGNNIINGGMHGIVGNMNDTVNLTANGSNEINTFNKTIGYGIGALNNSQITLESKTQSNEINSAFYGVYAGTSIVELNAKQDNNVNGGAYGIFSHTSSDVDLDAGYTNRVSGKTYGVVTMSASTNLEADVSNIVSSDNVSVYGYTGADINLTAKENNIIYAGELNFIESDNMKGIFGSKKAIDARSGSVITLDAGNTNDVYGAVYANGTGKDAENKDVPTTVTLDSVNNIVKSYAVISGAGDIDTKKY